MKPDLVRPAVSREGLARAWWRVLVLFVAVSVLLEGVVWVTAPLPLGLGYFTIQSNLLVLAAALPLARDPWHDGPVWRVVRLDSLLGITVTGLVFAVVLAPYYHPTGLSWWTNIGLHYVSPVLTLMGWALWGPWSRITWSTVARAMLWPAAWVLWTLVHGAATGWYPYGFLDVGQLGLAVALRNVGVIVLMAFGFLLVYRVIDRRRAHGTPVGGGG